ncbi:MAG: PAS domain S-box protein [Chloroflexi bacterium]|nr:PAS domain S-box protein [Chloroflexota bacterium]
MKDKRLLLYIALAAMLALLPVATMRVLWPYFLWQNEPLHSTVETVGALAAILMAVVLLQRRPDEGGGRLFWVAMGLLGAGILDGFHATAQPGHQFVLLHSTAALAGGFGFALVWLPESLRYASIRKWVPWAVIAGSVLFGLWTLLFRETLPVMVQDGRFTTTAMALNLLSGVFFVAAAGRFLLDFHHSIKAEPYLFSCMALLFGLASLTFTYSALWDDVWWFWHAVRLSAYLLVMGVVVHGYLQTASSRKRAEERIAHLTLVLKAVRNVNQLITREEDRECLIQKSCELLVEGRGYENAWILLLDENKSLVTAASAGLGEYASIFLEQIKTVGYPPCLRELLAQEKPFIAYDEPGKSHQGCVLAGQHSSQGVFRCRLEYQGKFYGALGVTVPSVAASSVIVYDEEEQGLFLELCGDIAFALANIERKEEYKQAEEALYHSEERFRQLSDASFEGIAITEQGKILDGNHTLAGMLRCDLPELIGKSILEFTAPAYHDLLRQVVASGYDKPYELECVRRDGSTFAAEICGKAITYNGRTARIAAVRDISERKRAEEALNRQEERYRNTLDAMIEGCQIIGYDWRYLYVNDAIARQGRYPKENLLGHTMMEMYPGIENTEVFARLQQCMKKRTPQRMENEFTFPDGAKGWFELCGPPGSEGISLPSLDIPERQQAEAKAREKQDLREVDRLRTQLLANVSHELRTPLTSIKGFVSTLLRPDIQWSAEEQRDFLHTIDQESDRLTRLISDLLDMSRLEAGALKLDRTDYSIVEILDSIGSVLAKLTEHHQLKLAVPPDLPPVLVDILRIGQVLTNLVENAARHSADGTEIIIEARLDGGQVVVSVTDRGVGIPAEHLDRVFDRFYQVENVVAGRKSGTGLGLSICHGILEAHSGKIWVESKLGEGSKFSFTLPVSKGGEEIAQDSGS